MAQVILKSSPDPTGYRIEWTSGVCLACAPYRVGNAFYELTHFTLKGATTAGKPFKLRTQAATYRDWEQISGVSFAKGILWGHRKDGKKMKLIEKGE